MKRLSTYLRTKEILIPIIIFFVGLAGAYIGKKTFTGIAGNCITIIGCLATMSATEMLAKEMTRIRMYEDEQNKEHR